MKKTIGYIILAIAGIGGFYYFSKSASQAADPDSNPDVAGVKALTPLDIESLTPLAVSKLKPGEIQALTTSQIEAFRANQIPALSFEQFSAMSDDQLLSFTTQQYALFGEEIKRMFCNTLLLPIEKEEATRYASMAREDNDGWNEHNPNIWDSIYKYDDLMFTQTVFNYRMLYDKGMMQDMKRQNWNVTKYWPDAQIKELVAKIYARMDLFKIS